MNVVRRLTLVPDRPPLVDVAIAGALSLWAVLEVLFLDGPGPLPVRLLAGLAMTVPLIWRRTNPFPVVMVVLGVLLARSIVGGDGEQSSSFFPAILLATFSAALYTRDQRLAIFSGAFAVGSCITSILMGFASQESDESRVANLLIISFFVGGAWAAGWLLRRRVAQSDQIKAESDEMARLAVTEERARIARELHDIVAHSITVISVQAGAAELYVERDPAKARAHLDAVQESAHDALSEMRRLTGVLREEPAEYEPQPGLSRLEDLIEDSRRGGLEVELDENGERPVLPPGIDLAVYRITQEALTNARKHAGKVPATVTLEYSPTEIEVEVTNLPPGEHRPTGAAAESGGQGLVGMSERVRVYGGTLETGETPDGGFRVHAVLPLEEEQ